MIRNPDTGLLVKETSVLGRAILATIAECDGPAAYVRKSPRRRPIEKAWRPKPPPENETWMQYFRRATEVPPEEWADYIQVTVKVRGLRGSTTKFVDPSVTVPEFLAWVQSLPQFSPDELGGVKLKHLGFKEQVTEHYTEKDSRGKEQRKSKRVYGPVREITIGSLAANGVERSNAELEVW